MDSLGWPYTPPDVLSTFSFLFLFIFDLAVIYPFFIYVYQRNRERDKEIAVFQIIDHFYTCHKRTYVLLILVSFGSTGFYFTGVKKTEAKSIIVLTITFGSWFFIQTITEVNHMMLSLLAIQRFTLYFFPKSIRYLNFDAKKMKRILWAGYGVSILYSGGVFLALNYDETYHPSTQRVTFEYAYVVPYGLLNIILFITAFLYIPVFISIRKLVGLTTNSNNQPQKYIFWQFATVIVSKIICTTFLYFAFRNRNVLTNPAEYVGSDWFHLTLSGKIMDALTTPIIIQVTYLSCNKRNVMDLLSTFKTMKMLKIVCCPCLKSSEIAVFQIIDHFYTCHIRTFCLLSLVSFGFTGFYFTGFKETEANFIIVLTITFGSWFFIQTITEVNHMMLSLLAIQRFTLYFFPKSIRYLNFDAKKMRRILWACYGVSILYSGGVCLTVIYDETYHPSTQRVTFEYAYVIPYGLLNIISFLTAFLYIPVFMSIRKLVGHTTNNNNQPQKYILWQFATVVVTKIICIIFFYFAIRNGYVITNPAEFEGSNWLLLTLSEKIMDALTTPIIIQVTYLSCNKRNVKDLFSTFKTRKMLKIVCCPCLKSSEVNEVMMSRNVSKATN